jgi:hypothetical protein
MKSGVDFDKSDSLLNLYCTKRQLDHLNSLGQEQPGSVPGDTADEFLKTQMYDSSMSEVGLNVRRDSLKNDCYYVTYKYGSDKVTVKLSVLKDQGYFKIDHVFIPGFDE